MDRADKERLRINRLALIRDCRFGDVKNYLIQESILSINDCEIIESAKTSQDKMAAFIDMLPRRGSQAYVCFRQALKSANPHLCQLLDQTQIPTVTEQKVDLSSGKPAD